MAEAFPSISPARGLHELAEEIGADLLVAGSSRHSALGQVLAGNVGRNLLHGAPCAVAIAPKGYAGREAEGLRRIVVGLDGSAESRLALEDAVELARATGAGLRLVAVARAPQVAPEIPGSLQAMEAAIEGSLREELGDALASIPAEVATEASLITGDPAAKLGAAADTASLLVLGSRGYGPVRRVLLGSVSSALVARARCPVLVRPRAAGVGDRAPAPRPALRPA